MVDDRRTAYVPCACRCTIDHRAKASSRVLRTTNSVRDDRYYQALLTICRAQLHLAHHDLDPSVQTVGSHV